MIFFEVSKKRSLRIDFLESSVQDDPVFGLPFTQIELCRVKSDSVREVGVLSRVHTLDWVDFFRDSDDNEHVIRHREDFLHSYE